MQYCMQNNHANIVLETELGGKKKIIIIAHVQLHLFKSNRLILKNNNAREWR